MKGCWRQRLVAAACLLLVWGAAWSGASSARAQASEPAFEVSAVSVRADASATQTRLDLYMRVPYESLRFLRTAEGFAARYEVTAEAYRLGEGGREALAERRVWEREVTADDFEATRSNQQFDPSAQSMALRPGRYRLVVRLSDRATDAVLRREQEVQVRDLSGAVAVSDLLLLDAFDAASNTISPRVSDRLSTEEHTLQLFYELYTEPPRRVRITREVARLPGGGGLPVIGALFGGSEGEAEERVTYTQAEMMPLEAERTPAVVTIPLDDMRTGEYLVRVTVEDERGRTLDSAERRFTLQWTGLVAHIRNLEEAVDQLRYVAKDRDMAYIREGRTPAERTKRFQAFWEKRDPTPGTERNERMEEYYYRVAQANRAYGEEEGWTTDRGHVLVLFGEPDDVESHPYNAEGRPYEVWHYNRIGRRFIFVDRGGGAFELLEPIWNEPSRIR